MRLLICWLSLMIVYMVCVDGSRNSRQHSNAHLHALRNGRLHKKGRLGVLTRRQSDDSFTAEGLKAHNKYRAIHGAPPLKLSSELSKTAQAHAEKLASEKKLPYGRETDSEFKYGENIASFCTTEKSEDTYADEATTLWYDDVCKYKFTGENAGWGFEHFTYMVWKASTKLGLGRATGKNEKGDRHCTYVVARYDPKGNIYEDGEFEKNVEKGSFESSYCKKGKAENKIKPEVEEEVGTELKPEGQTVIEPTGGEGGDEKTTDGDGEKREVDGEKPEVDGEKPEREGEKPEVDGGKPEVDGEKPEAEGEKPEVEGEKPEVYGEKPEVYGEKPEVDGDKEPDGRPGEIRESKEARSGRRAVVTSLGDDAESGSGQGEINTDIDEASREQQVSNGGRLRAGKKRRVRKLEAHTRGSKIL